VPWGAGRVAAGMLGWFVSFGVTGLIVAPLAAEAMGYVPGTATAEEQVAYVAALQALETLQGLGVIWLVVRTRPEAAESPLPDGWFDFSVDRPFDSKDGWLLWALVGYASLFLAIAAAAGVAMTAYGLAGGAPDEPTGAAGTTVQFVLPLVSGSPGTVAALFSVTSIFAPMLEETVFRGFLLASLTRWMNTPAAIGISSLAFASAHFAPRDFIQLTAMGAVLGASYARTRRISTPIFIHAAWNSGVLALLVAAVLMGYDLDSLI